MKGVCLIMTLNEAIKRYPDSFIVLMPNVRDKGTGMPLTYRVFAADEAILAERQYMLDGLKDVCVLPTYKGDIEFPPEEAARFFRVMYGAEGRTKVPAIESVKVVRVAYGLGGGGNGNL